jgi:hypothetical protein
MSKLFIVSTEEEEPKCGGCNWRVGRLYALAETQEEAQELYGNGDAGLCGDCMCDLIVEGGRTVEAQVTQG